jgi:N-dimethylarginine dimethylaminohydrolase
MPEFSRPTILMCPPDFYGIEYEINPWMSRSRQSDVEESRRQWNACGRSWNRSTPTCA